MKLVTYKKSNSIAILLIAFLMLALFCSCNNNEKQQSDKHLTDENTQSNELLPDEIPQTDENFADEMNADENQDVENTSDEKTADLPENMDLWNLLLVNPWNKIPDNFSVELTQLKNGHSVDKRAYPDLQEMMDDARAQGLSPIICSSYRTNEKQKTLFNRQVSEYVSMGYSEIEAENEAAKWVAVPGTSEHQTGLAVDIVALDYQILDENQENTEEQKWLMENAYKYGFILRYPIDKSEITGINYEPWHYRYVGKEAAKEIFERKICLEEYLANG